MIKTTVVTMTEAFANFYSSDQLQKVDWKRVFQQTHSLPYGRLVADLRSDNRPLSSASIR